MESTATEWQRTVPVIIIKVSILISAVCLKFCSFLSLIIHKKCFYRAVLKAHDTVDRHGVWQMLRVYGVGGKLLKAVQSFYVDSRACVRVGNDVSE